MGFYLNDIYTLGLVTSSIIFTFLIFLDKNRIKLLLEYIINQKYSVIYHRNDSLLYKIFVSCNTLMILSVLISFYVFHINNEVMSLVLFIKINCLLFTFFLLKTLLIYLLGNLFEVLNYSKKYYYSYSTNLYLLSIVFFPLILAISYYDNGLMMGHVSLYLFYLFILAYFILKVIMFNRLNLFKISFIFYNILYLCALEVLPYIGLLKLFELVH